MPVHAHGDACVLREAGIHPCLFQVEGSSVLRMLGMGFCDFHRIPSSLATQSLLMPFQSRNHDSGDFEGFQ